MDTFNNAAFNYAAYADQIIHGNYSIIHVNMPTEDLFSTHCVTQNCLMTSIHLLHFVSYLVKLESSTVLCSSILTVGICDGV